MVLNSYLQTFPGVGTVPSDYHALSHLTFIAFYTKIGIIQDDNMVSAQDVTKTCEVSPSF